MTWFRVDNRLVHGQVIEGWLPHLAAQHLVVANDAFAADLLRQQIAELAVPEDVDIHFVTLDDLASVLESCGPSCLVLFEDCRDARRACDAGVAMETLNIGNLHYAPGKEQLLPHIAVSEDDREDLRRMKERSVSFDLRRVPTEHVRAADEQLF